MLNARRFALIVSVVLGAQSFPALSEEKVVHLLTDDLAHFYTVLRDFGKDANNDDVFTVKDGILRISGQHWGSLVTKKEYENYRLVVEWKWGEKTWAPRAENARDSGVLVHVTGPDKVWPKSIEAQIIEGGTGDILVVEGAGLTVGGERKEGDTSRFDRPGRNPWEDKKDFVGPNEIDNPVGEWNTMEVICKGDTVKVIVNGTTTLEGVDAEPSKGKILIQSEAAEIFFRKVDLYPF